MNTMKKAKLLKKDFDNAVKQEWSTKTCLIAQCLIRNGIDLDDTFASAIAEMKGNEKVDAIMNQFDSIYADAPELRNFDWKQNLKKLRASLPILINLP